MLTLSNVKFDARSSQKEQQLRNLIIFDQFRMLNAHKQ